MTFFENLLTLLLAAIVLLQIARRLGLPYPAMLAAAGVAVAFVPGAPAIPLDPEHPDGALFGVIDVEPVLAGAEREPFGWPNM